MLATRDVLAQPADGYNLLLCTHFESINTVLYKNPGFKLSRPRAGLADREVLLRPRALEFDSREDDRSSSWHYAKTRPGEVSYGTLGAGSAQEIMARQFEKLAGISMNRIPFRTGSQVMPDLIAGRVHFYVSPTIAVVPQYQAKQLKILGVTSPERLKGLPDVPTLKEKGIDYVRYGCLGVCAREGTPPADRRSAQPPYRLDRGDAGIPRSDREGRLAAGVLDARGTGASHRTDAGRRCGYNPRIRNAAGVTLTRVGGQEMTEQTPGRTRHDDEMGWADPPPRSGRDRGHGADGGLRRHRRGAGGARRSARATRPTSGACRPTT